MATLTYIPWSSFPRIFDWVTILRLRQNRHFSKDVFICILIQILQKFVPKDQIGSKLILVQIMVWQQTGDKPLFVSIMIQFTYAYVSLSLNRVCRWGAFAQMGSLQLYFSHSECCQIKGIYCFPQMFFIDLCKLHWLVKSKCRTIFVCMKHL